MATLCKSFTKTPVTEMLWKLSPPKINSWNTPIRTISYYHVTCAFQSESTLYSCLNIKELLARNRRDIWSLSDSNGIWTQNQVVRKRILNRLPKLALMVKCLSVRWQTKWLWVRIPLLSLGKYFVKINRINKPDFICANQCYSHFYNVWMERKSLDKSRLTFNSIKKISEYSTGSFN